MLDSVIRDWLELPAPPFQVVLQLPWQVEPMFVK